MLQHVMRAQMVIPAQTTFDWQVFINALRLIDNKLEPMLAIIRIVIIVMVQWKNASFAKEKPISKSFCETDTEQAWCLCSILEYTTQQV